MLRFVSPDLSSRFTFSALHKKIQYHYDSSYAWIGIDVLAVMCRHFDGLKHPLWQGLTCLQSLHRSAWILPHTCVMWTMALITSA